VLHPQFASGGTHSVLTKGLGASPGAAVGRAYFSADDAAAAASRGEAVVLVRSETSPEDVHGMLAAQGILTARGGLVSHAAVVARGWGKPAVVGAEALRLGDRSVSVGDVTVAEGEWLSIDGTDGTVVLGQVPLTAAEPSAEFLTILEWADDIRRGHLRVRANADTGADAANGRSLGAEGIGLCRTEHMFLAEDRLPIVRRMILADSDEEEKAALEELRVAQRADFVEILHAMDGLPVTVRLLDPPLHEFLPSTQDLAIKEATVGLDAEERRLFEAAKSWQEVNPMLGTRGVRLGVIKPGLYAMQVSALMEAATHRVVEGGHPVIEVMIPLTVSGPELALARRWVEDAVARELDAPDRPHARSVEVSIGTMIETPRAALRAADLAEYAEFFSFGTNDLTQMTFGFSRDDVEGRMMSAYLEEGLLARNPFEVVDAAGVGELVRMAVERGRAVRPDLKIGVCGEHGGDPASISTFYAAGLDYVSCSPFRVPVARLAAAQAVLESSATRAGTKKAATKPAPAKRTARKSLARKAAVHRAPAKKLAKRSAAKKAGATRVPAKRTAKKSAGRAARPAAATRAAARRVGKQSSKRTPRARAAATSGRR
jgi:pyruvate, orthophosphate dikinase